MSITHKELKDYAAGIADSDCDETLARCSISRGYYAAFHAVLPFVSRLPASANNAADHVTHHEVGQRLKDWNVGSTNQRLARMRTTAAALAKAVKASRLARVEADYYLDIDLGKKDAIAQRERTSKIISMALQLEYEMSRPVAPVSA